MFFTPIKWASILGIESKARGGQLRRTLRSFLLSAFAMLVVSASAFADDSTGVSGHVTAGGDQEGQVAGGQLGGEGVTGILPFTGLDLALVVAVGLILLGLGIVLRTRAARSRA